MGGFLRFVGGVFACVLPEGLCVPQTKDQRVEGFDKVVVDLADLVEFFEALMVLFCVFGDPQAQKDRIRDRIDGQGSLIAGDGLEGGEMFFVGGLGVVWCRG